MAAFTCVCTDGRGLPVRLEVVRVTHPCPGVTVRVRQCPACKRTTTTDERHLADRPAIAAAVAPPLRT